MPKYEIASTLGRSYKSVIDYAWWINLSSYEKQYNIGQREERNIDLQPTFALGRICGLIMGDGCIYKQKTRNYTLSFASTRKDFIEYCSSCIRAPFPNLTLHRYNYVLTRKFPNGSERSDMNFTVITNSKQLYSSLRPYKFAPYQWRIPKFLNTLEAIKGFLQGIFDAEGCVSKDRISLSSICLEGLQEVGDKLSLFNINPKFYAYNNQSGNTQNLMNIYGKAQIRKFRDEIHFGYLPKKERLEQYYPVGI